MLIKHGWTKVRDPIPGDDNERWRRPGKTTGHSAHLVKAVSDALNGLAWRDDAQIHTLHISKVVAAGDEQSHVQVRIAREATA